MNNKEETRYDYFLIWGNGLHHKDGILDIIREEKSLKIIKIFEHKIKNMKKFVKEVYSHDYAPYQHLKDKTKYLLSTDPKVIFIFVKNKNKDEDYFGDNEYRHIESKTIRKLKEIIRNKYNEKKEEKRTENHVIHASDNENQTDYILKYLGHQEGIDLFEPYSDIISIKELQTTGVYVVKEIPMQNIYCSIISSDYPKKIKTITKIENSPHFKYVDGDKDSYIEYINKFQGTLLQDNHNPEVFDNLIKSFHYLDKDNSTGYILTKKLRDQKYIILDGLHRASILKHKNEKHIISAVLE
ncbi:MAG: hypothetical protein K9L98_01220 [Candidatus Pacebacteria bacterium]|nr:hypothetical protein [Candidatus Paceibacterota bacterium]MCF7862612.1 hypothetical protein [Candidatus Paceibacterota bacterium]